ncbi:MAG: hypothetical protein IKJ59_14225 [Clostridia bacterium]|nr:hypothetical protein [Clostridia bacterium]
MYWKKKKLTYDILIPPLTKKILDFSAEETESYFRWFMQQIPSRIEYLTEVCSQQLKIDRSKLDLSAESLVYIWEWFLKVAEIEQTPKAALNDLSKQYNYLPRSLKKHFLEQSKEQLSLQTEYIIRDIGMYIGEVFVREHPVIYWGYYTPPQLDRFTNSPLLLGFEYDYVSPFKVPFEPIHMVGVQAANLFDKSANKMDLIKIYRIWERHVPG